MLRTIEVSIVILIFATAFIGATYFAVLPSPRQISSPNLRQLALTALQVLDTNKELTRVVFKDPSDHAWTDLEIALSASLLPNLVYNLTVYDLVGVGDTMTYQLFHSITNSESGLGTDSEASTYLVTTTDISFTISPERISRTLYILNCGDANGWWITGYTGQTLAADLYNLFSPYFETTILINSTSQLRLLLDNSTQIGGTVQNAAVINTFGEAVPIPAEYCQGGSRQNDGYDSSRGSYAKYFCTLGAKTRQYNWTWVSIVGYPFYYVSNTGVFTNQQAWGIYGSVSVGQPGINSFLQGLDSKQYSYDSTGITASPGVVHLSSEAFGLCNYYGIYPTPYQTSTRALSSSILTTYHLTAAEIFNRPSSPYQNYIAGATYRHTGGGAFTAIGLTRTPDVRISGLALLMYYRPTIYKSELTLGADERPTQRLIVLQLSQQGGS
jgi:hypothetical protein